MADIIFGGGLASSLTKSRVERRASEDLGANVRIVCAVASIWRVDGTAAERGRLRPSWAWLESVVHIPVGTGNDDLEVVSPLTTVVCIVRGDGSSPENALDVCRRRRIVATIAGVLCGITLKVWTN